jgi:predicted nuclease of predicted toxin-antitoxin system
MRILLDENLPMDLIEVLRALGHDVEHVCSKNLSGHPDPDVRALSEAEDRVLMTQDIRFADVRDFATKTHAGFILVRLKNAGLREIIENIRWAFETRDVETWRGCFVVVSDFKVRVRPPE